MKLLQRLATTSAVIAGAVLTAPLVSAEDVDLEMVLLIDTSGSVDDDEFDKQMKGYINAFRDEEVQDCLLYTSPSPRDLSTSRMPSSA